MQANDAPRIEWIKVSDAFKLIYEKNQKLHDIGALCQSIEKHGWQELPKYDHALGAIKAGNGRIEAAFAMERDGRYKVPRGMATDKSGAWCIPILVGVDARSKEQAIAYLIDSNNLVMSGGNFTMLDMSRMWNAEGYLDLLRSADAEMLLSMQHSDIDALASMLASSSSPPDDFKEYGSDIETEHQCPKCGYSWSGKAS